MCSREGMLGGQAVLEGHHHRPTRRGDRPALFVVALQVADRPPPTMQVEDDGGPVAQAIGPVDADRQLAVRAGMSKLYQTNPPFLRNTRESIYKFEIPIS